MSGDFTCAACHGTFEKGRTDAEAEAEHVAMFGSTPEETDAVLVCTVCYLKIMASLEGVASA